jgi:signal transduction histidine kinase
MMAESPPELELLPDTSAIAEGKGQIRPRARILKTIGAELISSEVVAVIELVRNSFDADAKRVELVFDRPEDPEKSSLEIRDDGHGMTQEVLLGPWLEPATDHKTSRLSDATGGERSPGGRRRLGSKGVGRFAAQRLGNHLTVRTRGGGKTEMSAWFDWTALNEGMYLDELEIRWRRHYPKYIDLHGTHLQITKLRDKWTHDRFERLKLGLSRLISPSMDDEFTITITVNGSHEEIQPALALDDAMYSIEGVVEAGGTTTITYTDLNGGREVWERTVLWPDRDDQTCGPFQFRIAAWDLDSEPLRHFLKSRGRRMGLRDFRRVIRDHSGIALYRDDFRILPYGEPDNDWLRLDRRRVNNPTLRLSNNQILGTIQLKADANPELRDQTNREGLVTNEAYNHLQHVVLELLGYLEGRRFQARRSSDLQWKRRSSNLPSMEGDSDRLDGILASLANGGGEKKEGLDQLREAIDDIRNQATATIRQYAGAATSGQLAGLVFRQLRHPVRQVRSDLDLALGDLRGGSLDAEDMDDLRETLKTALQHLDTMEKRMEKLDPLAMGGRGRRVSDVALGDALREVVEAFSDEFVRAGVTLHFEDRLDVVVRTNREVVQQALTNLLDNALHWATQGEGQGATIQIAISASGFSISDSGPGIPEQHRSLVFEPHFTTRPDAAGLGLTLVKDLLKTVGGRVRLADPKSARFVVDLVGR